jgi:hypothetical protein
MDKINEAIGLAKRIQNEINCGNFDNALYLTDTFVFLFSGHQAATRELVTSYVRGSKELLAEGKLEQAEALITKALTVDPENSQLSSILIQVKKGQNKLLRNLGRRSLKAIAREFIARYLSQEMPLFDSAWGIFKDVRPADFSQEAVSGALGIVGEERAELNSPKTIVLLNHLGMQNVEGLPEEKVKELAANVGRAIGCSQELIDRVTDFILKG